MNEKHFKILEFLIKQTTNISYKDFPLQLKELFPDPADALIGDGLLLELEFLKNSKQWVESSRIFLHEYKISLSGIKAFKEANSENFVEGMQSQKIRRNRFVQQPVLSAVAIGLFVLATVIVITHYVLHIS